MKIKEIIRSNLSVLNYRVEVNGEPYDKDKHGDLVHLNTEIGTYEEYNPIFNVTFYCSIIKFTAIEQEKMQKLLESEGKDADNSISAYMDKRINEISKE